MYECSGCKQGGGVPIGLDPIAHGGIVIVFTL